MTTKELAMLFLAGIAVLAWMQFADQPTKRNLGRALRDTLPLL